MCIPPDEIVDDDVFGIEDIYRNLYFQFRKQLNGILIYVKTSKLVDITKRYP